MNTAIVTMTPEWAQHILDQQNFRNRLISNAGVEKIVAAINQGDWKITHQGIAIDTNDQLLDGQHRLTAIVRAGQPVEIMLTTGCDPKAFDVVDCGRARTASDALQLLNCLHPPKTASGIKHYLLYIKYHDKVWSGVSVPPHTSIVQFYEEHRSELDEYTRLANNTYKKYKKLNQTALVTLCLLAADKGWPLDILAQFFEGLSSGAMLKYESPILAYRRYLENANFSKNKIDNLQQHSICCIIKCFNYWIEGVNLRQFKPPALSPMPIVQTP